MASSPGSSAWRRKSSSAPSKHIHSKHDHSKHGYSKHSHSKHGHSKHGYSKHGQVSMAIISATGRSRRLHNIQLQHPTTNTCIIPSAKVSKKMASKGGDAGSHSGGSTCCHVPASTATPGLSEYGHSKYRAMKVKSHRKSSHSKSTQQSDSKGTKQSHSKYSVPLGPAVDLHACQHVGVGLNDGVRGGAPPV